MAQSNEQGGNGRTEVGKILDKTFDWGREWERLGYDGTQPTSGWTINDGVEAILEWHNQDRKQHELDARKKLLEELTRKAKRYNENDPVVDLDIWAVPLVEIETLLKSERERLGKS